MAITFELLQGERILIQTLSKDYDYATEGGPGMDKTLRILDQQTQPVFYIIDMLEANFSLDDLMSAASLATRQNALFKHPNVVESIIITQSRMIDLAIRGMNSPIFGNVKIKVLTSREEALDYARHTLSIQKAV